MYNKEKNGIGIYNKEKNGNKEPGGGGGEGGGVWGLTGLRGRSSPGCTGARAAARCRCSADGGGVRYSSSRAAAALRLPGWRPARSPSAGHRLRREGGRKAGLGRDCFSRCSL